MGVAEVVVATVIKSRRRYEIKSLMIGFFNFLLILLVVWLNEMEPHGVVIYKMCGWMHKASCN